MSTAAATLLGLLFVVITLVADRGLKDKATIRIYLTPAVIYLSSVLLMSTLLTVPNQTWLTAIICVCLVGIAGLGYSVSLAIRRGAYEQRSDLFPYVVLPFAAYALMVAGGLLLFARPGISLALGDRPSHPISKFPGRDLGPVDQVSLSRRHDCGCYRP